MKPARDDLLIYRGDTLKRSYKLRDEDTKDPIDITGWTFLAQVRKNSEDDTVVLTPTVSIVDATGGEFKFESPPADTKDLTPGRYVWDLQSTTPAGEVDTWVAGEAIVAGDVSRNA